MASFRKRGDLQWQARISRKGFPDQVKTFSTRTEAEAWARLLESEFDRGIFVDRTEAESTSLRETLERYKEEISSQKRGAEHESYTINAWLSCFLADRKMATIRGVDIATLRDEWLKTLKPATVTRRLALLSHLFNISRREWGMESLINPCELVRKPQVQNARTRRVNDKSVASDTMSGTEIDLIKAASDSPTLATIIDLAIETAMRRGEIASLEWENIDLKAGVAHLPKTKNGTARDVPLSPKAIQLLKGLDKTSVKVFDLRADAITRAFVRARDRARERYAQACKKNDTKADNKVLINLRFHDLRHEAASRLADIFPLHELTRITGHKDPRMLMRYYHPKASDLAKKMQTAAETARES